MVGVLKVYSLTDTVTRFPTLSHFWGSTVGSGSHHMEDVKTFL